MGAGSNRDANAIEALRFFQIEERLGKVVGPPVKSRPNKHDRDSHRYYLASEGKADFVPGKARHGSITSFSGIDNEQQSTAPGSDVPSECDSLPLGAEWSTCRGDNPLPVF